MLTEGTGECELGGILEFERWIVNGNRVDLICSRQFIHSCIRWLCSTQGSELVDRSHLIFDTFKRELKCASIGNSVILWLYPLVSIHCHHCWLLYNSCLTCAEFCLFLLKGIWEGCKFSIRFCSSLLNYPFVHCILHKYEKIERWYENSYCYFFLLHLR